MTHTRLTHTAALSERLFFFLGCWLHDGLRMQPGRGGPPSPDPHRAGARGAWPRFHVCPGDELLGAGPRLPPVTEYDGGIGVAAFATLGVDVFARAGLLDALVQLSIRGADDADAPSGHE